MVWPPDDQGSAVAFTQAGDSIYVTSSLGVDTTELQLVSTAPGAQVRTLRGCSTDQPIWGVWPSPHWPPPPLVWLIERHAAAPPWHASHPYCPAGAQVGGVSPAV